MADCPYNTANWKRLRQAHLSLFPKAGLTQKEEVDVAVRHAASFAAIKDALA